jgi:hypothetical protein
MERNSCIIEKKVIIIYKVIGYFYKIGKKIIYLTEEETETLNNFRKQICA